MIIDKKPLVTVVIPSYNREKTIKFCLDSVLSQNYPNIEIIVVDDCSTDNTVKIAKSYGNVKVFVLEQNSGAQVARNRGIREAKAEWIVFLDSDETLLEGSVQFTGVPLKLLNN